VPGARKRRDLFGIIDIIAVVNGQIVGIQAYRSGHKKHVERLYENADFVIPWLEAGGRLEFWWWRKLKGKWLPRVIEFVVNGGNLVEKEVGDAD